ncbi:hypothetical protein [Kitasatospora arboriphila]|uniref:Uncharacterized protein n=1 Tax=Kitasatospora arboriphila TaxID=258052 RepID=A0ABP4EKQ5_9ACTN
MDSESPVRTRRALHAVAELVLAGLQFRTSGTIRLRASLGGFATRAEPNVQVVGADLVAPQGFGVVEGCPIREHVASRG